jgi:hypothetical protein
MGFPLLEAAVKESHRYLLRRINAPHRPWIESPCDDKLPGVKNRKLALIGQEIRRRKEKGLSQEEFAGLAGRTVPATVESSEEKEMLPRSTLSRLPTHWK